MLLIRIFKQYYKVILGCTVLLAAAMFFASMFFPKMYESNAAIFISKQATFPESLEGKAEWILPSVTVDDLKRLINGKEIQKEIGLRLLASHLNLHSANPDLISAKHFKKIRKSIPSEIWVMARSTDSLTYLNLLKHADEHPFLIEVINHPDVSYYSNAAISSVSISRIGTGDMIAISYTLDDAGISRKTLELMLDVYMRYYADLTTDRNSKMAAYYKNLFENAETELRSSEEKLLKDKRIVTAGREGILKQLFIVREKASELGNTLKIIENQIGSQNPVANNQVVVDKQRALNDLYHQLMTGTINNHVGTDTAALQMQIKQVQYGLNQEITDAIAGLPGEEATKKKVTNEYSNTLVAIAQTKAQLAILELQWKTWYTQPALAKLPSSALAEMEVNDRNFLNALDQLHQSRQYQQSQSAALPIQIIEKPNDHEMDRERGIVYAILGGIAGFILSFALVTLKTFFGKKLKTPEKTEQQTGLRVAGIIPNAQQLLTCSNSNHIKNSLLYQMLGYFFQPAQKQRRVLVASIYPEDGKTFVCDTMSDWLFRKGKRCKVVTPNFEKGAWRVQNTPGDELVPIESLVDNDILIMKLSPLITGEYPVELIRQFNIVYLVCNAGKEWLPSDSKVMDYFMEQSKQTPQIILNNVDLSVVEATLGKINVVKTYFASPQRSSQRVIRREHKLIRNNKHAQQIVKTMPNLGVILDKNRQIVYANEAITSLLGLGNMNKTLGLRPGELVSCIYSDMTVAGCGTSKSCQNCGAVNTIVKCIKSRKHEEGECRINSFMNGQLVPFKFKITCSPFEVNNEFFVITNLADIKGEEDKRRELMEKAVTNAESNGDLSALSDLIGKVDEVGQLDSLMDTLRRGSTPITEEIIENQRLIAAENGELKPQITSSSAFSILDNVVRSVRAYKITQNKEITLAPPFPSISITTDSAILEQILRNMLKNAVEAIPAGGIVYIGYEKTKYAVTFYVFNEGTIPGDVQSQIFQKEFTTKEKGRGFGTYGMKLLGERCLRGHVGFKSTEESGTRFFITLLIEK